MENFLHIQTENGIVKIPLPQMVQFASDCGKFCRISWLGQESFKEALEPREDLWLWQENSSWFGEA